MSQPEVQNNHWIFSFFAVKTKNPDVRTTKKYKIVLEWFLLYIFFKVWGVAYDSNLIYSNEYSNRR